MQREADVELQELSSYNHSDNNTNNNYNNSTNPSYELPEESNQPVIQSPRMQSAAVQWIEWKALNNRPASKRQIIAGISGLGIGATAAAVNFDLGWLVAELMANKLHTTPEGAAALELITALLTILARGALGSVAAQDTCEAYASWTEEPIHRPRKQNKKPARIIAKILSYTGCGLLGIMGIYIHMLNLNAPYAFKLLLLPGVYISNAQISQVVFDEYIDWAFDINSTGASHEIVVMRQELREHLRLAIKAIYAMNTANFENFYRRMVEGHGTGLEKLQYLFALRETIPTQDFKDTWLHTLAGSIGVVIADLSAYSGTVNLSYNIAAWICSYLDIKDKETEEFLAIFISTGTYIPYSVLLASSTKDCFKNLVDSWWYQRIKPQAPTRSSNPKLRRALDIAANILGPMSAVPNVWWAVYLGTNNFEKALALTAISPALVYTGSLKKLFSRGVDFYYEHISKDGEAVSQKKFIANVESIDTVIAQLPDEDVAKMHRQLITNNSSSSSELLTPLLSTRLNERGFFNNTAHPAPETVTQPDQDEPSYWNYFKSKVWSRK